MVKKEHLRTQQLVEEKNQFLADALGVEKLDLKFWVSEKCKSDYGMFSVTKKGDLNIKISEFVIDTPLEEYMVEHEVTHAYVHIYCPEYQHHGPNFKEISNKVFDHTHIRKPWVKRMELLKVDADFENGEFKMIFDNKIKALITYKNGKTITTDPQGNKFKHPNTTQIYEYLLKTFGELAEDQGFPFREKMKHLV